MDYNFSVNIGWSGDDQVEIMTMMKISLLGLGVTGNSILDFLCNQQQAQNIFVFDSRENIILDDLYAKYPNVKFNLGVFAKFYETILSSDIVILSPGIDLRTDLVTKIKNQCIPILSDIEIFQQNATKPIIAITGTNGKSTVTKLCSDMLKEHGLKVALGGNYGIPALSLLDDDVDVYIIELSSFQLDLLNNTKFHAGVVLNISPDHLDRYDDFEEYKNSKLRLYEMVKHKIVDSDKDFAQVVSTKTVDTYSPRDHKASDIELSEIIHASKGQHLENVLASIMLTNTIINVDTKLIVKALQNFSGLSHRCELVSKYSEKLWFNDSKGTNPAATIAAIQVFSESGAELIVILGGLTKGASLEMLCDLVVSSCNLAVLIGASKEKFYNLLKGRVNCVLADSLENALMQANNLSCPGDVILFSPGGASFDMFNNFEHRGECFVQEIKRLSERDSQQNGAQSQAKSI
ncbi:MAG: UDP-N-acetylmuramoyl-L-alanine--D-glutamate ligase [Francisellaceae bacterium]|nr:UDP-N-acetylmuramoyl-L-alanine--D-glutamate ligase [Francisellaceae bacterium]